MESIKGKLYLFMGFALAGTSVVTGRILSGKLGTFQITALSLGILLLALLPFYGRQTLRTARALTRGDWTMLVLQAIFGIFLFRVFLLFGVNRTSTAEAGILTGATPAVTSLLAFVFLKESLSKRTVMGVACTVTGIVLLQGINLTAWQFSGSHTIGNLLILCAAASESIFNILSRRHKMTEQARAGVEINPLVQTMLVSAFAFTLSLGPALFGEPIAALLSLDYADGLALIWYGLVITALAFVFFYAGIKRCDAYTTAAFSGMMPLTSMLLSLFLLKETINAGQWIGGALIIVSILLIAGKDQASLRRPRPALSME
jgi:drug/metabolite transporter (DMT)-like permease